jgi:hypothetical protein
MSVAGETAHCYCAITRAIASAHARTYRSEAYKTNVDKIDHEH